jgi:hypothetical protein
VIGRTWKMLCSVSQFLNLTTKEAAAQYLPNSSLLRRYVYAFGSRRLVVEIARMGQKVPVLIAGAGKMIPDAYNCKTIQSKHIIHAHTTYETLNFDL